DSIERGKSTKLRWTTENAKIITIEGIGEVPASGERDVSPRISTTYTLSGVGDGGTATASARVTVIEPPAPVAVERPRITGPSIEEQFRTVMVSIFFDYDKFDLKPTEEAKLRQEADWLNQDKNRTITFVIEGNCDPRGTAEYNIGLGDRRARAVKDFLGGLGVDPNRVDTISYGLERAQGREEGSPDIVPSWAHDRRDDYVYKSGGVKP
ncbi:MAG: OmpA family protein, partial [Blastocatellia bacterium]|nr:OmpA family protein [Blastocatellia bacterium]